MKEIIIYVIKKSLRVERNLKLFRAGVVKELL
jgi:hypothetical protein